MIELSPAQESARSAVRTWLRDWRPGSSQPFFYLAGYAGTGKTTIARVLAEDIGSVCFAAYTGKAAHVMRTKGCHGAKTIHSLIYKYEDDDEKGSPTFGLDPESAAQRAGLIVVDECSMVDRYIGEDLLSFRRPVLVLGDPAQLPPVGGAGYFTGGAPDFLLTEIRRQELESPILRLATTIREGGALTLSTDPLCTVARKMDADPDAWKTHDQVIVGTNALRRRINGRIRERLGHGNWLPKPTERVICLRNSRELGLFNGQPWEVAAAEEAGSKVALAVRADGRTVSCKAHAAIFQGRDVDKQIKRNAEEFDFSYAITGHKSQGSEWPSVLAFDQSSVFGDDSARWLYTVVTRAAERLTVLV